MVAVSTFIAALLVSWLPTELRRRSAGLLLQRHNRHIAGSQTLRRHHKESRIQASQRAARWWWHILAVYGPSGVQLVHECLQFPLLIFRKSQALQRGLVHESI